MSEVTLQTNETKERNVPKYHTYQCPRHLYERAQRKARIRRKKTGQSCNWTTIVREILERKLEKKKIKK